MSLKLNRDDTINLIRIYGEYECLWNCRKKIYKDYFLKKEAWENIANYFGTDVNEIKKKLKYLRTAYVAERRKLDKSKKSSMNPTEVYQPKLFYYNDFNYLDNTIVLRKRQLSDDDDDEEMLPKKAVCYEELSSDTNEQLLENESVWEKCAAEDYLEEDFQEADIKKTKIISQQNTNTKTPPNDATESAKNFAKRGSGTFLGTDDMYLAFGKSIGLQLRHLKPVNAAKAMARIQETLTEFAIVEV